MGERKIYCACGCGQEIVIKPQHRWEGIPRFIRGHHMLGRERPEHSERMSGEKNFMYGKHHTEESNRKNSEAHKGKSLSDETKRKISEANTGNIRVPREIRECACGCGETFECRVTSKKRFINGHNGRGVPRPKEVRIKISKGNTGKVISKESRRKQSEARIGKTFEEFYGNKEKAEEHKRKIGEAGKGRVDSEEARKNKSESKIGDKNPAWLGGTSFEPYSQEFNEPLKRYIRERDNYTCQICGKPNSKHVHHIDYNKENCNEKNLITVCIQHNNKMNYNRKIWMVHLQEVMERMYKWGLEFEI